MSESVRSVSGTSSPERDGRKKINDLNKNLNIYFLWDRVLKGLGNSSPTVSPAVELSLQLLDGLLHGLVLLLLLLIFPLPLLGSQLQVNGGRVSDGLGAATQGSNFPISIFH